jgi:hypothetical protein
MVVWGGESDSVFVPSGGRYNPSADRWTNTSLNSGPEGRDFATSVWAGSFMIAWGGLTDDFVSSGGRYAFVDGDGDGEGDATDCAPAEPSVSSPPSVTGLVFGANKATMTWNPAGPSSGPAAVAYDVIRGSIAEFPVGGMPSEACVASEIAVATTGDATAPAVGQGLWWLVRGENVCGHGFYGLPSGGSGSSSSVCP